ncbi:DUF192 domain-containing protein [Planctomycetota bacterium]
MKTCAIKCGEHQIELEVALGAGERMKGLLGRDGLDQGKGYLLPACTCVHTWFMKFPLDLVYINADMTVVKVCRNVKPFRMSCCFGAETTLELAAGEADRCEIEPGTKVEALA